MRMCAIDPGTAKAGWAMFDFEDMRVKAVESGLIIARGSMPDRLASIYAKLEAMAEQYKPEAWVYESGFVPTHGSIGATQQTALAMGMAKCLCLLIPAKCNIPIFEYAPATVKKAVTGNARSKKPVVARMIKNILGITMEIDPDQADALAVGMTHALKEGLVGTLLQQVTPNASSGRVRR